MKLYTVIFVIIITTVHALQFKALNKNSIWPSRNYPEVHAINNPLTYIIKNESYIAKPGSFIMYGGMGSAGSAYGCWLSTDYSVGWLQLPCNNIFPTGSICIYCSDHITDMSYAIDYNVLQDPNFYNTQNFNTWNTSDTLKFLGSWNRNQPSCVVNSYSEIIYFLGSSMNKKQYYTDVWASPDFGHSWKVITNMTNIPPRINQFVSVHYNNTHLYNKDILYVLGGTSNDSTTLNDLWASSDSGQSWIQILTKYPWNEPYTGPSGFRINSNGILVYMNINIVSKKEIYGEIWSSLDGGYTWGICTNNTEYGPRYGSGIIWGQDGYLRIIGGTVLTNLQQYTDSWISDINFNDVASVASTCNIQVPKGGIGVLNWPS